MQVTIVGAGAVGLNLATRLAATSTPTVVVSRRREAADRLARDGLRLEDPATGEVLRSRPVAVSSLDAARLDAAAGPLVLCVRTGETEAVARLLADRAPGAVVASAQNDVDNEAILARHFARVIGVVVRQTCTLRADGTVLATGRGRLVVGRHPEGRSAAADALADRLAAAGFDVGRSTRIERDKWLKLCHNGTSAVNALVRRTDHRGEAFVALKIRLLGEARDALAAAGIAAQSCDGRDPGLDAEIAALRSALAEGRSARDLPLYNACWTALADPTRPLEADAHHRRILDLARRHGTAAPTHAVLLEAVIEARDGRLGPECLGAEALLERARRREAA